MEDRKKEIVLDQTDAALLRRVAESGSLMQAAKQTGVSYRTAWNRVEKMETTLGRRLVQRQAGAGREGAPP
jgi:molybdate transport system regulatory protein